MLLAVRIAMQKFHDRVGKRCGKRTWTWINWGECKLHTFAIDDLEDLEKGLKKLCTAYDSEESIATNCTPSSMVHLATSQLICNNNLMQSLLLYILQLCNGVVHRQLQISLSIYCHWRGDLFRGEETYVSPHSLSTISRQNHARIQHTYAGNTVSMKQCCLPMFFLTKRIKSHHTHASII
jgi:hypothetical protein